MSWIIGCIRHRLLYCEACNGELAAIQAELDCLLLERIEAIELNMLPRLYLREQNDQ